MLVNYWVWNSEHEPVTKGANSGRMGDKATTGRAVINAARFWHRDEDVEIVRSRKVRQFEWLGEIVEVWDYDLVKAPTEKQLEATGYSWSQWYDVRPADHVFSVFVQAKPKRDTRCVGDLMQWVS